MRKTLALLSLIFLIGISGCGKSKPKPSDYAGKYVSNKNSKRYIELKKDGTFVFARPGVDIATAEETIQKTEGKWSLSKKLPSGEWEEDNLDIDLNAPGMLVAPYLDDGDIFVPGTFGDERFVREGRG